MKHGWVSTACALLLMAASGSASVALAASNSDDGFANDAARQGYALGMNMARQVQKLPVDVDAEAVAQGFETVLSGKTPRLSDEKAQIAYRAAMHNIQVARVSQRKQQADDNLKKSKAFLAANKSKPGVKTTSSGLQYKVLEKGDGPQPDSDDVVTVHYIGKLVDGTVFDSSRKRGQPATFPVNGVIKGWTEALQMMHVGAHYKLFVPADLAYGARGRPPVIEPNQALIFDVELLKVDKK